MHRSTPLIRALAAAAILLPVSATAQTRVADKSAPRSASGAGTSAAAPTAASAAKVGRAAKAPKAAPAPSALESAAKDIASAAKAGAFRHPHTGALVPAGAVQAVAAMMSRPSAEADAQLLNALMLSGQDQAAAEHVMHSLSHLLDDPSSGRVESAQERLERFMDRSPQSYQDHPPAEVLAIDGIVARLVATDENARAAERARKGAREAKKHEKPTSVKPEKSASSEAKADRKADKKAKEQAEKEAKARAKAEKEAQKKADKEAREQAERDARAAKSGKRQMPSANPLSPTAPTSMQSSAPSRMQSSARSAPARSSAPARPARKDGSEKKPSLWRRLLPFV